ncbi:MAG: 3-phosphoglycerate dehydrogenase [Bacteroidales bacterium]|nr:3-phosphoglycerate dehydrogenase [Bacteroidales bacterium]
MKVLVATEKPFAATAVNSIRAVVENAGYTLVLLEKYTDKAQLIAAVADADALIVRSDKVDAQVIGAAPKLKVIVRAGAGYDNIDLEAATAAGICVENTPGQNSNAVAELVFGMAVMAARNMFDGTSGSELKDKTLGIHAFGQVGRNVARIAKGFGMEVSALDPFCPAEVIEQAGVKPVSDIKNLYSQNKVVSIHIPATPQTKGSIGYDLIASMPKGGILVNTARKEVIDEEGLRKALADRPDIKYVADVKPDNAAQLEQEFTGRVFFTPKKMGAQTAEANINAGIAAAEQTVAFLKHGIDTFRVNR